MLTHEIQTLIPISVAELADEAIRTVNARDLHAWLKNGDHFAGWIKARVEKYGFVEGQDYVSFSENTEKPQVGRPSIEFHISLDMAKELSMVENNDRGREARRYFIRCEKAVKEAISLPKGIGPTVRTLGVAAKALGFEGLDATIAVNTGVKRIHGVDLLGIMGAPLLEAEGHEDLLTATGLAEAAGLGVSAQKMNKLLEAWGFQIKNERKNSRSSSWLPTDHGKAMGAVIKAADANGAARPGIMWRNSETLIAEIRTQFEMTKGAQAPSATH